MNAGACNIHSTNRLLPKCILCLYGCAIHTLPILWYIIFLTCISMKFHYKHQWHVLCLSCIFSTCCLQYASILQAANIFQVIKWLYFSYPPTKGNVLGSKCDNTHIHNNTEYEATAHFMHVKQLLSASCVIISWLCIIYYSVGFTPRKELALLDMQFFGTLYSVDW